MLLANQNDLRGVGEHNLPVQPVHNRTVHPGIQHFLHPAVIIRKVAFTKVGTGITIAPIQIKHTTLHPVWRGAIRRGTDK